MNAASATVTAGLRWAPLMPGRDVDAERDAEAPGPGDAVVVAERTVPGDDLRHDADSEQDQDHGAGELGHELTHQRPPTDCATISPRLDVIGM